MIYDCNKIRSSSALPALFRKGAFLFVFFCCLSLFFSGCSRKTAGKAQKIRLLSGSDQCAMPGESFAEPLKFVLEDASGIPVSHAPVSIRVREDSDLGVPAQVTTDESGVASFSVTAGKKTGDQHLLLCFAGDKPPHEVRFVSGITIEGDCQESSCGAPAGKPLSVRMARADGTPAAGIPVYFTSDRDTTLSATRVETDASGVAAIRVTPGTKTGSYPLLLSVSDKEYACRPVELRVLGLNLWQLLFGVGGGLALFIFGMKLMSNGLRNAAGERIRAILRFFSKNRIVGMLAGIGVTIALQSSSATTVMLVGFINAGLMNLSQSIGIMLGAHIGTTLTAQLIAFQLDSLIMPAIILGLTITFFPSHKMRGLGDSILGFGLLFFGMKIMSDELRAIAEFPSFIEFFRIFDCSPVNGILPPLPLLGAIAIGMLVTMIIQGSSATAGIVIALGSGGLINIYTAVALVLGANIGTTITAILASLPANRVAKQAACANTLCAVIGVAVVSVSFLIPWGNSGVPIFFQFINWLSGGDALAGALSQNMPRNIANAHTVFNIFTSLLLLPFAKPIAKLSEKIIPASGKVKFQYLEPHLLSNPAIALEQSVNVLRRMLSKACKMVERATGYFIKQNIDEEKIASLDRKEKRIDKLQFEITNYLTQIMQRKLSSPQANVIPVLMHCTNDAERVADHTETIVQLIVRLQEAGHSISRGAVKELEDLRALLIVQSDCAVELLEHFDAAMVRRAMESAKKIDEAVDHFEDTHIQRLREQTCQADVGVIFIEMLSEIKKVSDRLSNIVERAGSINRSALGFRGIAMLPDEDDF